MAPSQRVSLEDDGITTIPQLLEHLKKQTRLSDRAMAQYVGVAPTQINEWRRGIRTPESPSCRKIAAWAGLEPEYVLRLAGHLAPVDAPPARDPVIPEIRSILETFDADEQRLIALPLLEAAQRLRAGLPPPPPSPPPPPGPTPGTPPNETPQ